MVDAPPVWSGHRNETRALRSTRNVRDGGWKKAGEALPEDLKTSPEEQLVERPMMTAADLGSCFSTLAKLAQLPQFEEKVFSFQCW
jgi:hypothetical protein